MIERLKNHLNTRFAHDKQRLIHIYGVAETAIALGLHYGDDVTALEHAALLHDITKNETKTWHENQLRLHGDEAILSIYTPPFYHGFTAAYVAEEHYGVTDQDTLNAIRYHTVGRPNMTLREQLIFVSDYIEPNRSHNSAKTVYPIAFSNLPLAIYKALQYATDFHQSQGENIPAVALQTLAHYKGVTHDQT